MRMRATFLGTLSLVGPAGAPIELAGGRPRILFACLVLREGRPVARELLASPTEPHWPSRLRHARVTSRLLTIA